MDNLPFTTKGLLTQIDPKSTFDEVCENLKEEHLSKEQLCTLMSWLVQCWMYSLDEDISQFGRYSHGIPKKVLHVEHLLEIVRKISCEKLFCQVLLLLPEGKKSLLLLDISQYLLQSERNELVCVQLIKEAFTSYSQNFMYGINATSLHARHLFIKNCTTLLNLTSLIPSSSAYINCFYLLENVLPILSNKFRSTSFQLDKYDDCSKSDLSILNKMDIADVQVLHVICKKLLSSVSDIHSHCPVLPPEMDFSEFVGLLRAVLIKLTDEIIVEGGDVQKIEHVLCDTLLYVLVRLKIFILKSDYGDVKEKLPETSNRFFYQCSELFNKNELVQYVCRSSNASEIVEMLQVCEDTDKEVLKTLWADEQSMEKKFIKAVNIVNNLYCCYEDVVDWLLDYEFLIENQCEQYRLCLKTYCINYGTLSVVEKILLTNVKSKLVMEKSLKYKSLQGVLLDVLSYLSIPSCNELLKCCHHIYQSEDAFPWLCDFELFSMTDLTETINKISNEENPSVLSKIGRFCLISPRKTLAEVLQRVFCGNLSASVVVTVVGQFPSLLEMQLCKENKTYPSFYFIIKECYCEHQNRNDALKILSQLIRELVKVFPSQSHVAVICMFVVPNLLENSSEKFFDRTSALQLLNDCLQITTSLSAYAYLVLLQSLFHEHYSPYPVIMDEFLHSCRRHLVDKMASNFEVLKLSEQEEILDTVKTLAKQLNWLDVLYFYDFFCAIGYVYQYAVPSSLFRFCDLMGNPFWSESSLNVTEKWLALLQVGVRSLNVLTSLLQHMPDVEADEEIPNIIEAVTTIFSEKVQKFTGTLLADCLQSLVKRKKIKDVVSYFSTNLQDATECHGMCFALFIFLQAFLSLYCDVSSDEETPVFSNVEGYVTLLHEFANYSKDISNVKVRIRFIMYFTEQLVYLSTILNEGVMQHISLLGRNLVKIVTGNLHLVDGEERDTLMNEYDLLLSASSSDLCLLLKNRFHDGVVHLLENSNCNIVENHETETLKK